MGPSVTMDYGLWTMDYEYGTMSHHIIMIILLCSNLTQPGPHGSFDQVEAPAPDACGPTDEPLASVAAVAAVVPSLPDEALDAVAAVATLAPLPDKAWFVHMLHM